MIIRFKRNGFTLVEAILVGALIAIIAVVTVPIYKDFTKSTKESWTENLANTVATKAALYFKKTGNKTDDPTVLKIMYDNSRFTITIDNTVDLVTVKHIESSIEKTATIQYN